jgi:hypothetical protein
MYYHDNKYELVNTVNIICIDKNAYGLWKIKAKIEDKEVSLLSSAKKKPDLHSAAMMIVEQYEAECHRALDNIKALRKN